MLMNTILWRSNLKELVDAQVGILNHVLAIFLTFRGSIFFFTHARVWIFSCPMAAVFFVDA
ncbi:hypothetical protein BT96DRAFT_502400 [Gymnopus androsaceus JB14]|uniref:Uncharacterized protein n=1 Tax=Gymnopus androsaceus JB14 TaxID=1447944 RepID=A0A6A4GNW3_9AGAR|nr:hypothetical protein BT96DRAFT_502400 [Gymnopus androsaceus JB14]